jgi:predicted PurR-regulated permease PerM
MMEDENRLVRIEKKLDDLINRFHNMENSDVRQVMRLEHIESRVEDHSETLKRYFERLENLENKPGQAALKLWGQIGSIALSIIVTAIITFVLVYTGVKK